MRLLNLLEGRRSEVLEFQQALIDRLPDCFDFELESVSETCHGVRVSYEGELVALISFVSLRPFNATLELISRHPDRGYDASGFSAWTDYEGFFKHLERALGKQP